MSSKQFISAEEHLAKIGITVQQANDFIVENIDNPELLFSAARQNGVTNGMLSEITNFSTSVISEYFVSAGFNNTELDYTSLIINSDLEALETLVDFNNKPNILSNTALSEAVRPLLDEPLTLGFTFTPTYNFQPNDGIYDSDELGVGHLSNVPATDESIESLFYGTLINMFEAFDEAELNQINGFPEDGNPEEFQTLLTDALSESPSPVAWTDEELANLVSKEAAEIINKFWSGESELVGVLDHSYLGLITA